MSLISSNPCTIECKESVNLALLALPRYPETRNPDHKPLLRGIRHPSSGEGVIFEPQQVPEILPMAYHRSVRAYSPLERYRGTSLIGNSPLLGPYGRTKPRAEWWS